MSFFKIPLAILIFAVITVGNTACKQGVTDYDREKVYLDSLQTKLNAIEVALNIDEQELQKRISLINTWYVDLKDTSYDVAKKMQVDFNGFKIVYNKYIDNFFAYTASFELLKKQYNALEEKVKQQSISREEFKKEYKKLKQEIIEVFLATTAISKPVYDLEFSWKRYYKDLSAKN